jgi:hypothetical protein
VFIYEEIKRLQGEIAEKVKVIKKFQKTPGYSLNKD